PASTPAGWNICRNVHTESGTPAGWNICRNGHTESRTPAGCNIRFRLENPPSANELATLEGAILHPAGVRVLDAAASTNMPPLPGLQNMPPLPRWMHFQIYLSCGF